MNLGLILSMAHIMELTFSALFGITYGIGGYVSVFLMLYYCLGAGFYCPVHEFLNIFLA